MNYKLKILSLGAGVQSSTILLMSCKGELPRLDAAIFADTGWERNETYIHLEWLRQEAGKHGIEVITVNNGNIKERIIESHVRGKRWVSMPFFTDTRNGTGMLRRLCTKEHKITPIKRQIRKMLGLKPRQRAPKDCVEQWIGISTDEAARIFTRYPDRMSVLHYPLLEHKPMSRHDCEKWLWKNYHITVPKSACIGCPYHHQNEWRALDAREFKEATEFDEIIRRKGGIRGDLYLHRSCVPLGEVDFRTAKERGQMVFDFYKDEKLNLFVNEVSIHA
ncbi:MAG: hypothetical protein KKD18_02830 [Nanoarchaeota archaeon]|nr:hypothetical protein [Nanoarchaeota archaeon]